MNINIPLDFEGTPEFWKLKAALCKLRGKQGLTDKIPEPQIHSIAIYLWVKLWVVLGYQARSTNRPGWLSPLGEQMLREAVPLFGDDCSLMGVLSDNLLRPVEDGWQCDLFAALNAHTSGDYKSAQKVGNLRSRLNAQRKNINAAAMMQAQLLPPEVFKKRDGTPMSASESERCTVLVMTLDRCLRQRPRRTGEFTPGLMADAAAAIASCDAEGLQAVYYWVTERRDHPATPKTAEEVLIQWDKIAAMAKASATDEDGDGDGERET